MHAKIVPIGTSKGIRIPKYLLDKYCLDEIVEVDDTGSGILIRQAKALRAGWAEAFKKVAGSPDDKVIDMPSSAWDEDWEW